MDYLNFIQFNKVLKIQIIHVFPFAKTALQRDKISLRIEIPHCDHSKIIGRKGKNTQDIMRDTMCHIHFPDSNRIHDMEKNNQVL